MTNFPYRPNVCLIILDEEGKVLVGERSDHPGAWQLPQGGLDLESSLDNEADLLKNALREASEELGVGEDQFALYAILNARHSYDWAEPKIYDEDTYRGQQQRFVALRFLGTHKMLSPQTVAHPEFLTFRWVGINEVQSIVESQRRVGYQDALAEVSALQNN